ncbi:MAG: radical SAM protein [Clostridia bacterium]|nr:radical SAM protein [Clostridia bacterium]
MKTHKNIAVFIPHMGCRNACVFCSQRAITGVDCAEPDLESELRRIRATVEQAIPTLGGSDAEIAFFGGSFTGIGEERMIAFLRCAREYLGGNIKGIRCSTRPDYIDGRICGILKENGVTSVELGIQSTDDAVLAASKRGHTAAQSEKACELLARYGFELGGQMMVGMPLANEQSEIKTARDIVAFGASTCRIYPMVVFKDTPLYEMTLAGEYTPLTNEEAARRAAACARVFIDSGVEILRIGLHSSGNLSEAPFGANHPALGELAEGEIYYGIIREKIASSGARASSLTAVVPYGELSKCIGHKGINRERLEAEFGAKINFVRYKGLNKYDVRILSEITSY